MKMYRQGDVLIMDVSMAPLTKWQAEQLKPSGPVLVYGETTGHAHRVEGADVLEFADDQKIIRAATPFRVVHEEHDTIEIPEGTYRVVRQREYDENEVRYVSD